jgi:hypothetical protein
MKLLRKESWNERDKKLSAGLTSIYECAHNIFLVLKAPSGRFYAYVPFTRPAKASQDIVSLSVLIRGEALTLLHFSIGQFGLSLYSAAPCCPACRRRSRPHRPPPTLSHFFLSLSFHLKARCSPFHHSSAASLLLSLSLSLTSLPPNPPAALASPRKQTAAHFNVPSSRKGHLHRR